MRFARVFSLLNKSAVLSHRITNRAPPRDRPDHNSASDTVLKTNEDVLLKRPSTLGTQVGKVGMKWQDKGGRLGRSRFNHGFCIWVEGEDEGWRMWMAIGSCTDDFYLMEINFGRTEPVLAFLLFPLKCRRICKHLS